MRNPDPKTETELARQLGCTRASLSQWRRQHLDAPAGKSVADWRAFLAKYDLGRRARGSAESQAIDEAENHLLDAEVAIHRAQTAIARVNGRKGQAIGAIRGKMVPMFERLWTTLN